jgi:hypothetical protein
LSSHIVVGTAGGRLTVSSFSNSRLSAPGVELKAAA